MFVTIAVSPSDETQEAEATPATVVGTCVTCGTVVMQCLFPSLHLRPHASAPFCCIVGNGWKTYVAAVDPAEDITSYRTW